MIIRWCSIDFFQIKDLGFLSSLLRFYVFFSRVIVAEFQSEDFTMSFKRISILIFLLFVLPGLIIWNHVGFYLDDIFYPDWKGEQVHRPLFIVGNARSGTTWLHRLIALDEATFTTFRTWEIIFGVSVTWKITIIYLYNLDQFFSSPLFRAMSYLEGCILGRMALHQVGLQEVEEDEWLMMHVFLSQLVMLFFPLGGIVLRPLVLFDKADLDTFPLEMRRQIFIYYKQCVKRHLYARSLMQPKVHASAQGESNKDNVIFLSKNPPFTMRLDELYETFPDCRVACLVRDPLQSVPSMISYIAKVWQLSSTPLDNKSIHKFEEHYGECPPTLKYPKTEDLLGFCIAHYTYPLEYFRKAHMSKDRFSFVPYKNLLKDVEGTVLDLLRQFRYLLDAESTVEAPSLSLVGVNLEVVGLRRNFDADDYDKSEFRLEDITDRHVVQAIDVTSLKGEAGVQPMHSVSMSSENVPFEGPIVENLAALLRREKLRAGTGTFKSNHNYSVEVCCTMSENELKDLLKDVYDAHPTAF